MGKVANFMKDFSPLQHSHGRRWTDTVAGEQSAPVTSVTPSFFFSHMLSSELQNRDWSSPGPASHILEAHEGGIS